MGLTVAQILLLAAGLPLLSFVLLIFFGRRMGYMAGAVGTLALGGLGWLFWTQIIRRFFYKG